MRLICLPFAGGGSAAYAAWRRHLPQNIDLVPVELPGHDGRLGEPPMTDLCSLADNLADDLVVAIDRPFALVGHSMGSWLTFELVRELRRRCVDLPCLVVVAACRPPHWTISPSPLHTLGDDEFLAAIEQRYDGIPAEIKASPEVLRMLLPALRADIQMMETYQYVDEPPLDIEILALGGADDPAVSPAQLEGWRQHTSRGCAVRLFPGGHFFLFSDRARDASTGRRPRLRDASPALLAILSRLGSILRTVSIKRPTGEI